MDNAKKPAMESTKRFIAEQLQLAKLDVEAAEVQLAAVEGDAPSATELLSVRRVEQMYRDNVETLTSAKKNVK